MRQPFSIVRQKSVCIIVALILALALLSQFACKPVRENREPPAVVGRRETTEKFSPNFYSVVGSSVAGSATELRSDANSPKDAPPQSPSGAPERRIVRTAILTLEIVSPSEAMRKIAEIAEALEGFVVTSDFAQTGDILNKGPAEVVTVAIRVPAPHFTQALANIRKLGARILQERVAGQDVTEEYVDLEARIRAKKALETQFLEIMKQAKKVSEALEVQRELANVRSELEQLEGRRRLLEHQASLSAITVTLQIPSPIAAANTFGFFRDIRQSFGDGIDVGSAIIQGFIRIMILLIPVGLMIILPVGLLVRIAWRRFPWRRESSDITLKDEPVTSE